MVVVIGSWLSSLASSCDRRRSPTAAMREAEKDWEAERDKSGVSEKEKEEERERERERERWMSWPMGREKR